MPSISDYYKGKETPQAEPIQTDIDRGINKGNLSNYYKGGSNTGRLNMSFQKATKNESNQSLNYLKLKEKTGLPIDLIERKYDEIKRATEKPGFNANSFYQNSPVVSEWLAKHPHNVSASKDEIARMGYLERQIEHISQQFKTGKMTTELADIGEAALWGKRTPEQRRRQAEIESQMMNQKDFGIKDSFIEEIPGFVSNQLPIYGRLLKGGLTGAAAGAGTAFILGQAGPQAATPEEVVTVPAGAILGWRISGGLEAARLEAGLSYLDLERITDENGNPIGRDMAMGGAAVVGIINGSLEMMGFEAISKRIPGLKKLTRTGIKQSLKNPATRSAMRGYLTGIAKAMATEGATEFAQEMVTSSAQELIDMHAKGELENMSGEQILARVFSEANLAQAIESGRAGAGAGGGITAVTSTTGAAMDYRRAKKAREMEMVWRDIGDGVKDSELIKELPQETQQLIKNIVEKGEVQTVYTPVDTWTEYWQSKGFDPEEAAVEVLGEKGAEEYGRAAVSGEDLQIPIEVYATKIAPTDHHEFFQREIRHDPADMNAREADEFSERMIQESDVETTDAEVETENRTQEIEDNVVEQLVETGMDEAQARTNAQVLSEGFRVLAERTGQDVGELFDRYGLQIGRDEQVAEGEQVFNQADLNEGAIYQPETGEYILGDVEANVSLSNEDMLRDLDPSGTLAEVTGGEALELRTLEVPQATQRQGLGTKALQDIERIAQNEGQNFVVLKAEPLQSPKAGPADISRLDDLIRFYETNGYQVAVRNESNAMMYKEIPQSREMFQTSISDLGFYSRMQQDLDKKIQGASATVDQVRAIIRDLKPEEVEWSGINEFLKGKKKIDKAELMDFLEANQLEIREVTLGGKIEDGAEVYQVFAPDGEGGEVFLSEDLAEEKANELNEDIQSDIDERIEQLLEQGEIGQHFAEMRSTDPDESDPMLTMAEPEWIVYGPMADDSDVFTDQAEAEAAADAYNSQQEQDIRTDIMNEVEDWHVVPTEYHGQTLEDMDDDQGARHIQWTLGKGEGLENYREILFTLPQFGDESLNTLASEYYDNFIRKGGEPAFDELSEERQQEIKDTMPPEAKKYQEHFPSVDAHFDEINVVAHARIGTRKDADGNDVLFIEEIQSDWHQQGRDKGYKSDSQEITELPEGTEIVEAKSLEFVDGAEKVGGKVYNVILPDGRRILSGMESPEVARERAIEKLNREQTQGAVPNAPFRKNWHEFVLKRLIRMAADQGYDKISWTTGDQQNDRYGQQVSELIDIIEYSKSFDGKTYNVVYFKGNKVVRRDTKQTEAELRALLGDGITKQIINGEGQDIEVDGEISGAKSISAENLRIGGEGMRTFYDKMIVKAANKIGKKYGAKTYIGEVAVGERDLTNYEAVHMMDMTEELTAVAREKGFPLFQDKKGRIRFNDRRQFRIDLLKNADLSTFLHETGHFYLEVLSDLAQADGASSDIVDDFQTVLDYLGVESADQIGVEQHERWARSFEAYLMEGKAPSVKLRRAFAKFRAWLLSIYRRMAALDVELTDDVRGVMDRLLATEEEIEAAAQEIELAPLFADLTAVGFNDEQALDYAEAITDARNAAVESMMKKHVAEIEREQKRWWNNEKRKVREEVAAEVDQNALYIALANMQKGKLPDGSDLPEGVPQIKLRKDALVRDYDKHFLKKLPRPYIYTVDSDKGMHHDDAAQFFGFATGDVLLQSIINSPSRDDVISERVDAIMKERHGDLLSDGTAEQQAMESIHNDKTAQLMRRELEILVSEDFAKFKDLSRRINRPLPKEEFIRQQAEETIGKKRVRDIKPIVYQRAQKRAAREANEAFLRGDFETAFDMKQRQLLNYELYRAANKAREDVQKTVNYMGKFTKGTTRKRIGKAGGDYLDQIDAIMDRYSFRKGVSLKQLDKQKSLVDWVLEQQALGFTVSVPQKVLNEAHKIHYKDAPLEELMEVRDTVKSIEHLSRVKNKLLAAKKGREIQQAEDEIIAGIMAHHKIKKEPVEHHPTFGSRTKKFMKRMHGEHTKPEFLIEFLDGNKALGPVWRNIFQPFVEAQNQEQKMMADAGLRIQEIFSEYTKSERAQMVFKKQYFPEIENTLTKANVLALALNWGNEYNRAAILEGWGWSESQALDILDTLDERDWNVVQNVWDYINEFWPMAQQLEKDLNGVAPPKVEADPFQTKFGEMRGGYYPLVFDGEHSIKQERLDEALNVQELFGGSFSKAATRRGHLEARTNSGGKPVKLDLDVLDGHIRQVVHDVTHRRAVIDVQRLLNRKAIREAIEGVVGREMYKQFQPWIMAVAADQRPTGTGFLYSLFGKLRTNATAVNMGFKLTTALVQPTGYLVSAKELGPEYSLKGLHKIYKTGPKSLRETHEFIMERSSELRNRMQNMDRDVRDTMRGLNIKGPDSNPVVLFAEKYGFDKTALIAALADPHVKAHQEYMFSMIAYMDLGVSLPTWMGAYMQAMDGKVENIEKGHEIDAIDYADRMVRITQGSGSPKDLAQIQRGDNLMKLFTMFYSYFSVLFNQFQRTFQQYSLDKNAPKLFGSLAMIWFIPPVLESLILGRGPDDDADPEEVARWVVTNWVLYPLQSVVLVRDLVGGMDKYGYSPSAGFDGLKMLSRQGGKAIGAVAGDDEVEPDRGDVKDIVMTTGYLTGLPSRQIWMTGEYFWDWLEGEAEHDNAIQGLWRATVTGKPKE